MVFRGAYTSARSANTKERKEENDMKRQRKHSLMGAYIIMAIVIILLILTSAVKSNEDKQYIEVEVGQGDTLWQYWNDYGTGRYDKWLYETMQLNGMDTAGVYEGQVLRLEVAE